jgi:hypothetical protein
MDSICIYMDRMSVYFVLCAFDLLYIFISASLRVYACVSARVSAVRCVIHFVCIMYLNRVYDVGALSVGCGRFAFSTFAYLRGARLHKQ